MKTSLGLPCFLGVPWGALQAGAGAAVAVRGGVVTLWRYRDVQGVVKASRTQTGNVGFPTLSWGDRLTQRSWGCEVPARWGREKVWLGLGMLCHSLGWCVQGITCVWVCVKCV